jgi:DmsE family decaheme c-type cytochrome
MGRFTRTSGPLGTIGGALVIWLGVVIAVGATSTGPGPERAAETTKAAPAARAQAAPPASQAKSAASGDYVGEEKCLECHEDEGKGYHATPHGRARNQRTPAADNSCETCHGPGKAHVDADGEGHIKDFKKMASRDVGETCTTCHVRTEHANWDGGKHNSRNITCTTCHSVHEAKSEKAQLKKLSVQETCVQCHRKEVNKVHKSSHMPVREGKMECTTCHNPHGSQNVKMLREGNSITEACASCHSEKRGPFLFEHAVGRENCVTCHDPHGSNNERMLVAKLPMLCQRCHIHSRHPATIYDVTQVNARSNRVVGRACVNCHQMVHGSNHPTSGKVFLR